MRQLVRGRHLCRRSSTCWSPTVPLTFDYCSNVSGKTNYYSDTALRNVGRKAERHPRLLRGALLHCRTAPRTPAFDAQRGLVEARQEAGDGRVQLAQATEGVAQNDLYTSLYTGGYNGAWAWSVKRRRHDTAEARRSNGRRCKFRYRTCTTRTRPTSAPVNRQVAFDRVRASEQQAPPRRSRFRSSGPGDRHRDLARQIGTGAGGAPAGDGGATGARARAATALGLPGPPPRQRRTGRLTRPRPRRASRRPSHG